MIRLSPIPEKLKNEFKLAVWEIYVNALKDLKENKSDEAQKIVDYLSRKGELCREKIERIIVGDVLELEKSMNTIGQIRNKEIVKAFEDVYEKFANREFGYQWAEKLGVTVCPYCNRNYIFTIRKKNGRIKARPQYDHFFPKSLYPYLAISMYNLIPSCAICNGGKSTRDSYEGGKRKYLNPYVEGYGTETSLRVSAKKQGEKIEAYLGAAKQYTVWPECAQEVDSEKKERINNTWELMKLGPLYEKHSDYIRDVLRTKYIYDDEYFEGLVKGFPGLFSNIDEAKNLVFLNYLDEENWGKRILAKLTHDLEAID